MVIELLAGKMRLDRGRIAAVEDHIRKGLTLLSLIRISGLMQSKS